jgi:hypothetical protein
LPLAYCVFLLLILSEVAAAQTTGSVSSDAPFSHSSVYTANEPAQALKDGKVIHAMRITGAAPVIDGSITDEAWSAAETGGGYVQRDPDNGAAMTERTRIQVAYDDRYLYVAVVCEDSVPGGIAGG